MQIPDSHIIVIFGASGDLTKRKLIPALFHLYIQKLLPDNFAIHGISRTQMTDDEFRIRLKDFLNEKIDNPDYLDEFLNFVSYSSFDYHSQSDYTRLSAKLLDIELEKKTDRRMLFYLSTPPSLYTIIPEKLANAGLNNADNKIIIEKPFGTDLASARELNAKILSHFKEDQVYRIDHYLGKETVQNIMVTRFSNHIFEPLWNHNYIHHVEITSSETLGVEKRGGYYDSSGAMRDMIQNHLLQLTGLIAMEPPALADATSIRNETVKVFQSIKPFTAEEIKTNVIRGQYLGAKIGDENVMGYREEDGVKKDSKTETFVAMKFFIDNWRWNGVPFYIRSGKRLPTRVTEVVIHFKPTPHHLFFKESGMHNDSNQLIIRIQPDEGILIKFGMKVPGGGFKVQTVNMDFHYKDISSEKLPEAYERLLLDCMQNDSTLYARDDAVDFTWKFIDPILKAWKEDASIPLYGYPAGTWGPESSDKLIEEPYLTWRYPCKNLSNDGIYCEL